MNWIGRYFNKEVTSQPGIVPFIACKRKGGDGLACIAMLFAYHAVRISTRHLHNQYRNFRESIGLSDIVDVLSAHGIVSQPLHCKRKELAELPLPAIVYWGSEKFAVLTEIIGDVYIVFDPGSGKLALHEFEFDRYYSEIVLQINPPEIPNGIPN